MKTLRIPRPYPKQIEFFNSTSKYTAYGGARGGGKSWAARVKATLLAFNYSGIQILLLRRTLQELRENHAIPLQMLLHGIAQYRDQTKEFLFPNGSRIVLGYCAAETDVLQYQGQAYDVIFLEESTHFTEFQFQTLTESNRPSGLCKEQFLPRMYFTCNPGGVGHQWMKRLFVDRVYQGRERPEDYAFIRSSVYDNEFIMQNDPEYVRVLENLPEDRKRAMLYGDWDVFEGQYFSEFRREIHVIEPFPLQADWRRYVALDYGLDMLAAYWIAVDWQGRAYVYREIYESGLIISAAAKRVLDAAPAEERIYQYIAPPDLWNRRQETGESAAEIFGRNRVILTRADNERVQGWYSLKEWLQPYDDEQGIKTANLVIFRNCSNLIRTLPALQFDPKDPNDVNTGKTQAEHELTHGPDAIRYFVAGRPRPARMIPKSKFPEGSMEDRVQKNLEKLIKQRERAQRYG